MQYVNINFIMYMYMYIIIIFMYSQEVNLFLSLPSLYHFLFLSLPIVSSPIPSLLSFLLFLTFSLLPPPPPLPLPPTSPLPLPSPPSPSSLSSLLIHQERLAPNVLAMVQSFNQLALLVPTEILNEDTHQQRAKVISAYIQVLVYINPGTLRTEEKMSYNNSVLSTQM